MRRNIIGAKVMRWPEWIQGRLKARWKPPHVLIRPDRPRFLWSLQGSKPYYFLVQDSSTGPCMRFVSTVLLSSIPNYELSFWELDPMFEQQPSLFHHYLWLVRPGQVRGWPLLLCGWRKDKCQVRYIASCFWLCSDLAVLLAVGCDVGRRQESDFFGFLS